jgi:chromosome segregation ATPase
MATNQQISPEQMRQLRAQQALSSQNEVAPSEAVYDQSTTEGQIRATRQQLEQARAPAEQFIQQNIYPARRQRAFTPRQQRAQIVSVGEEAKTQLAEVSVSKETFEREVATKAPEYALPQQKAQALSEAKIEIQSRIDNLSAKVQGYKERIQYYEDKHRRTGKDYDDSIAKYEDKIDVANSELRGWKEGMNTNENETIKRFFSG